MCLKTLNLQSGNVSLHLFIAIVNKSINIGAILVRYSQVAINRWDLNFSQHQSGPSFKHLSLKLRLVREINADP